MAGVCFTFAAICAVCCMFALGTNQTAFAQSGAIVGLLWAILGGFARHAREGEDR